MTLALVLIAAAVAVCPPQPAAHKFGGDPIYLSPHDRVMDGFMQSVVPLPPRRPLPRRR